jgi:hypothetical protein
VCALGALARHRGVDVKALGIGGERDDDWEDSDWDKLSGLFNIAPQLARGGHVHERRSLAWSCGWRQQRGSLAAGS